MQINEISIPGVGEGLKSQKFFQVSMKQNWNFQMGAKGDSNQKPSVESRLEEGGGGGGMDIF